MKKNVFFDRIREVQFKGRLSAEQVQGIEAILASCGRNKVTNSHHIANILAQVYRETGGYMLPIKETVMASHTNKNPSDNEVIRRLNAAYANGQLAWVKKPYWRDGAFGRGCIQLSHWPNYEKMGKRLGVPLRLNPDLALDPKISADIAVVGMAEGLFTGKKLSDYNFPAALDAEPKSNPRRMVNGVDGTDKTIAGYHRKFHMALLAAGYSSISSLPADPVETPVPSVPVTPVPEVPGTPKPIVKKSIWSRLVAWVVGFFPRSKKV